MYSVCSCYLVQMKKQNKSRRGVGTSQVFLIYSDLERLGVKEQSGVEQSEKLPPWEVAILESEFNSIGCEF